MDRLGLDGLGDRRQLGPKSVLPLECLVNAMRRMDRRAAADFLPLDPVANGPSLRQALEDLWFGGVDFRGFIRDRMPVAAHQVFFERVARSYDIRFHIADGRVRPAYTGLRVTVMAMLARHEGRVALSRVMELVARTGYHGAVPARAYQRLGNIWRREHAMEIRGNPAR